MRAAPCWLTAFSLSDSPLSFNAIERVELFVIYKTIVTCRH